MPFTLTTFTSVWNKVDLRDLTIIGILSYFAYCTTFSCLKYRILLTAFTILLIMFGFHFFCLPTVNSNRFRVFWNGLRVGAHRGLALDAPENTLAAFKLSKSLGADSVEFDLEFTKDGVPILLHDDTVDRTTDGVGCVRNLTFEEVRKLNAAAKFPNQEKFRHEKIPTLDELIDVCLELNVKIFFDLKHFHPKLVDTITSLFNKHQVLYETAAVCSFYPQIIYSIKKADPNIITGHTWRPYMMSHKHYNRMVPSLPYQRNPIKFAVMQWMDRLYAWSLHKWIWKLTGANLVLIEKNSISGEYIKMWRDRGLEVVGWTVNDYAEKLYFLNVLKCPFFTDSLSDLQEEMKKPGFCEARNS